LRPVTLACALFWPVAAIAQTPSAFAHWQDAAGIVLAPLGGPIPEWRVTLGLGSAVMPRYTGSNDYRLTPAPAFDIRWRDIAFLSSGDGLGVNLPRGETYRAGVAINYDVGRNQHLAGRLNGIGNVDAAPEVRLFGEMFVEAVVLSVNLRRAIGGHDGLIGDVGAYVPVVGTEDLVIFVGPSLTMANGRYTQSYFGISAAQAAGSVAHLPLYTANGGLNNATFGATAIYHFNEHWLVDADVAWERLLDSAGNSPIVQDRNQLAMSVIFAYQF
jgi:outer membrane scaffolding protein for murein synthesis (MipA/OmpV family)